MRSLVKGIPYWSQTLIALAQVTFGLFWASLFLPFDKSQSFVLTLNLGLTGLLLIEDWILSKR